MAIYGANYVGCAVSVYDKSDNLLVTTTVAKHDRDALRIEVKSELNLKQGDEYKVLILTSPTPVFYLGKIIQEEYKKIIAMYKGKEKEDRKNARHSILLPALIESLIYDGQAYALCMPLGVKVVNISQNGVRLRTPFNSLTHRDRFTLRMKIGGVDKLLVADVMNHRDVGNEYSEYGCRLSAGSAVN